MWDEVLIVASFVLMIVLPLVWCFFVKLMLVKTMMRDSVSQTSGHKASKWFARLVGQATVQLDTEPKSEQLVRMAYNRFSVGLATQSDLQDLHDFVDKTRVEIEHSQWSSQYEDPREAGRLQWKRKKIVSHFDCDELQQLLDGLENQLKKEFSLAYHFTDLNSAYRITMQG
eukprot:COSAG01_NODE_28973_length_648_cov_1.023679_1_plen_170_part_01